MRRRTIPRPRVRFLARAALIAALYAALGLVSAALGLAFGPVQLRLSEALCVLPLLLPEAVWGLPVGCALVNLLSPYGPLDLVIGSASTLLAALLTARCKRPGTAALPPTVCNAVLIGALLAWEQSGGGEAFAAAFAYHALTVALGEAAVCYALGVPLTRLLSARGF